MRGFDEWLFRMEEREWEDDAPEDYGEDEAIDDERAREQQREIEEGE